MKKYRLNIIKFTFEFIFVFCAIFLLSSTTVDNSTLAVSMNDNLAKSINKDVIQATQRELYEEGILRFNVPKLSDEPMMAIVLDRGVSGNVIDLLTESESYAIKYVGRVRNLEFEVLRQGWK